MGIARLKVSIDVYFGREEAGGGGGGGFEIWCADELRTVS